MTTKSTSATRDEKEIRPMMIDRFTEHARRVLTLAQGEAERLGHSAIGTEHILLGLIVEGGGIAGRTLTQLGVEPQYVRDAIARDAAQGTTPTAAEIGLTPRAKQAIGFAVDEARGLHHHYIGTEHLLLGLLRVEGCEARRILGNSGLDPDHLRAAALSLVVQPYAGRGVTVLPDDSSPLKPDPTDGDVEAAISAMTEAAREILELSYQEAARFNHNYIGTEHLLLGLVRHGDGVAARVLGRMGVRLPMVRSAVEFIIGRGQGVVTSEIVMTPRAKKVIAYAGDEMRQMNQERLNTEHLLLGLVREGEGIAAGVLESLGCNLMRLRRLVFAELAGEPEPPLDVKRPMGARAQDPTVAPVVSSTPVTRASIEHLLELLGSGRSDEEIGSALGVEESAVAARLGLLYAELGVDDRIVTLIQRLRDLASGRPGAGTGGDKTRQLPDTDPPEM